MTLRIGILGAARVATYAMIDAARDVDDVIVAGVAARDPDRARLYAAKHGIPHVFESYDALITSPDIDAVYNALPPNLHAHWSVAAVEAGKPVLCEKPFALSLTDVDAMLTAEKRTGLLIMEAQHSHYHPMNIRARDVVRSGMLGDIAHITARFDARVEETPGEIRYDPDLGGGALWDLGVYPVHWIRMLTDESWTVISAKQRLHASGADLATSADLKTQSGISARLESDMQADFAASLTVEGSHGTLKVTNPLAPQRGYRFELTVDGKTTEEHFPERATYSYQLEAFRDAVLQGAPVATRGTDSRKTVALMAAIRDAARTA
jgi:predicted dehydrogenase